MVRQDFFPLRLKKINKCVQSGCIWMPKAIWQLLMSGKGFFKNLIRLFIFFFFSLPLFLKEKRLRKSHCLPNILSSFWTCCNSWAKFSLIWSRGKRTQKFMSSEVLWKSWKMKRKIKMRTNHCGHKDWSKTSSYPLSLLCPADKHRCLWTYHDSHLLYSLS